MFIVIPIEGNFRDDITAEHSHTFAFLLWGGRKDDGNKTPGATKRKDVIEDHRPIGE